MKKTTAFVGARYAEAGSVLILGESSWGVGDITDADYVTHWLEHPNFLERADCTLCVRLGRARHAGEKDYKRDPLYDGLTTMMLNWPAKVTDGGRRDAWSRIAFMNFIGRPVETRSAADRPTDENWRLSARDFPAALDVLRPSVCLVLDSQSRRLMTTAGPLLTAAGVGVVRLAHFTMRPAPTVLQRMAAWKECLRQATRGQILEDSNARITT